MQAQYAFHHPQRPNRTFVLDTAKRVITRPDGTVYDPPLSTTKSKLTGKTKVVRIGQLTDPSVRLLVLMLETATPGAPIRNRDIMQLIWGDTIWLDKNPGKLRDAINRLHNALGPEGRDFITPDREAYRFHGVMSASEASPYRIASSTAWDCAAGYFIRTKYQRTYRTNIAMAAAIAEFDMYREIFDQNPLGFNTIYRNNEPCGIFNVWPLRAQSAQALIDGGIKWLLGPDDIHKPAERPFSTHLLIETAYAEKGPQPDMDALPVAISHFPHMAAFVTNLLDETNILIQAAPPITKRARATVEELLRPFGFTPVGPRATQRMDRLQVYQTTWGEAGPAIAKANQELTFSLDEEGQED